MNQEQLNDICAKTADIKKVKFLCDRGWEFENETEADAAYARMVKASQGLSLSEEEFLTELGAGDSDEQSRQLYHVLFVLVEKGALNAGDLYQYARFRWCRRCPEAVIACQVGPKEWAVNNCGEKIDEDRARLIINREWGFEAGRIEILGTPYYDATDWHFIRFRIGSMEWVMHNDSLYQIYQ